MSLEVKNWRLRETALMSPFLATLAATLEPLGLSGARVLVGVSGGPDSVALLCGLRTLAPISCLSLHAAHLNHGLRPGSADDDAEWTRKLCARLEIPLVVDRADVPGRARAERRSIEEEARIVRYEFFERTARALSATHVAVAHKAADRVETVLHHLLRGTGLAGLCGMKRSRMLAEGITLARPLLGVKRETIISFLTDIGQDYRTDATNTDQTRTRNRIRHTLLPSLEREFGPQVRESLLRLAEQADEVQSAIEEEASRLLESSLADESENVCRLDARVLAGQPRHVVREVFVALWRRKSWPRQRMGFDDWDRLYQLANDAEKGSGKIVLPGKIGASRRGMLIALQRGENRE
jgi:tRNA(Ile)-lysidine synthase